MPSTRRNEFWCWAADVDRDPDADGGIDRHVDGGAARAVRVPVLDRHGSGAIDGIRLDPVDQVFVRRRERREVGRDLLVAPLCVGPPGIDRQAGGADQDQERQSEHDEDLAGSGGPRWAALGRRRQEGSHGHWISALLVDVMVSGPSAVRNGQGGGEGRGRVHPDPVARHAGVELEHPGDVEAGEERGAEPGHEALLGVEDGQGLRAGAEGHARIEARLAGKLAGGLGDAVEGEDRAGQVDQPDEQGQEDDDADRELDERLTPIGRSPRGHAVDGVTASP